MPNDLSGEDLKRALRAARTQFDTGKTAQQDVVFQIDASQGLSRERYGWESNGVKFDKSLFNSGEGQIEISLSAATDSALIHSAYIGKYISQALSQPGLALSVADGNVSYNADGELQLSHGKIQFGPFWHDGTEVTDGFGFEVNETGTEFFAKSSGNYRGNTPVSQSDFAVNSVLEDTDDPLDLVSQTLLNFPYGWYNALPLTGGRVKTFPEDEYDTRVQKFHSEIPQNQPLLGVPNLPVSVYAENGGAASALDLAIGGMQYTRYGTKGLEDENFRTTTDYRTTSGGAFTASEPDEPDPQANPGQPLFAYQREAGAKDVPLKDKELIIDPTATCYIYFWDEWDPDTALNGTFEGGTSIGAVTNPNETKALANDTCTTYTPTIANFRGSKRVVAGQKNSIDPQQEQASDSVPIGATRVVSAVIFDGSVEMDLTLMEYEWEEGW